MSSRKYSQGVTVIELMITLVIIGVLAAIAVPSYNQFMKRSKLTGAAEKVLDRKSTRLNSSHRCRSYAVFCLKKKKNNNNNNYNNI